MYVLQVNKVFRLGVDDGMSIAIHETRIRRAIAAYVRTFKVGGMWDPAEEVYGRDDVKISQRVECLLHPI